MLLLGVNMVSLIVKYSGLAAIALSVSCGQPSNENIRDASIPAGYAVEEYNPTADAGNENMPPELRAMMEERVLNLNVPLCNNQVSATFLQQGYKINCGKYMFIYSHQNRQMLRGRMESLTANCAADKQSSYEGIESLTPATFDETIKNKPSAVEFSAEYCPTCKEMISIFEGFCTDFNGAVFCGTYDKDQDEELEDKITGRYDVFAVPMFRFFCNGKEEKILRLDGVATDKFCMLMEMSEEGMPLQVWTDKFCDHSLDTFNREGRDTAVSDENKAEYLQILGETGAEEVMPYWQEWFKQH